MSVTRNRYTALGSGTDDKGRESGGGNGCPGGRGTNDVVPGGNVVGGIIVVPGGNVAGGIISVVVATGWNRIGRIGISGIAGKVGANGGHSAGGIAELGGGTGANLSVFAGGSDASSLGARVSANCICGPNGIVGINSAVAGGSSALTSLWGVLDSRLPQRARAQLLPSVSNSSPFGIRSFFFVQYTFCRNRYDTY